MPLSLIPMAICWDWNWEYWQFDRREVSDNGERWGSELRSVRASEARDLRALAECRRRRDRVRQSADGRRPPTTGAVEYFWYGMNTLLICMLWIVVWNEHTADLHALDCTAREDFMLIFFC
ncbi:hypothetical protein AXF42_Ash004370 [Apostasia shenzhenica]|uniref:Uncharacterized protein n=1 Tax=Apostasia shenzhenica TaxID=1088818 RepID=A0A2I0A2Q6_9ASPA|nr:hypothetical protein AXF42_Ash004370 [Apostasia shenzhenica]